LFGIACRGLQQGRSTMFQPARRAFLLLFLPRAFPGGYLEIGAHVARILGHRPTRPQVHPSGRHGHHGRVTPSLSQHLQTQNSCLHLRGRQTPKTSFMLSPERAYVPFQTAAPFGRAVSCPIDGRACPLPRDNVSWFLIRYRFLPSEHLSGRFRFPPCTVPYSPWSPYFPYISDP
jgi:hypothetical protein